MTFDLEYNARSLPAADVARSFVPPEPHFVRLLSRNHTLLLGPRGSGKTTLLKMLTTRALVSWQHDDAKDYVRRMEFNAAFIPADVAWGRQVEAFGTFAFFPQKSEAAFVIHTLRALVFAMREAVELGRGSGPEYASSLAALLSPTQEAEFVKVIADAFGIQPRLPTVLGLELGLQAALDAINLTGEIGSFSIDSFASKLSLLISAFNGLTGQDQRRWALLFDELEIAPARIKAFLLSGIRSFDERIIVKLALAPYMDDAGFERDPKSPQPLHDYHVIQLTYPNKEDAFAFSSRLFQETLNRIGIRSRALNSVLRVPATTESFGRGTKRGARGQIPEEFRSLYKKDGSFREYFDTKGFDTSYEFNENSVAQDIRKVLPIVIARDYYVRKFEDGHMVANRSRKAPTLYTGFPSLIEITEGNPRAIMTMVGPMAQEYLQAADGDAEGPISPALQGLAIRRVELLLTSLLQVIPLDLGGFEKGKGLLDFVDQIGRAFEARLLRRTFTPDYVGTFILDDNVTPAVVSAVGKALNAGAFVHVPAPDSNSDTLLRGLIGQRFRLSYALASRFRLLLTLGDRVSLSRLLLEMRGLDISNSQRNLFGGDDR
ncbi:hypothetical protein NP945_15250 [Mesorhizobium sp. LMG17149]|uniref:ORC-CDC6 family AAA ATPase n=1 Tax=Mesorhizobium sp. LMG17149 TaxID=2968497 RepID=UPI00211989D2|nr:hypothetical protein [Mesorhizobium sp. LMG17149]MCQ8873188.1 hypothetical protein [Mesorhizobium sp. LMG17149]